MLQVYSGTLREVAQLALAEDFSPPQFTAFRKSLLRYSPHEKPLLPNGNDSRSLAS